MKTLAKIGAAVLAALAFVAAVFTAGRKWQTQSDNVEDARRAADLLSGDRPKSKDEINEFRSREKE